MAGRPMFLFRFTAMPLVAARKGQNAVYADGGASSSLRTASSRRLLPALALSTVVSKERPDLIDLNSTNMPAVLIEMAFVDNEEDARLLTDRADEFARAIARGITDFEGGNE